MRSILRGICYALYFAVITTKYSVSNIPDGKHRIYQYIYTQRLIANINRYILVHTPIPPHNICRVSHITVGKFLEIGRRADGGLKNG